MSIEELETEEVETEDLTFKRWQSGDVSNDYALAVLCHALDGVQSEKAALEEKEKELRAQISEIVQYIGGKFELPGFGNLQIANPTRVVTYERQALDELIDRLDKAGYGKIAQAIIGCRKESMRAGGLRITRAKNK